VSKLEFLLRDREEQLLLSSSLCLSHKQLGKPVNGSPTIVSVADET